LNAIEEVERMKPTWWLLYGIGLSLVGGLALVELSVREDGVRSVLEIAVVVIGFALMAFWSRRNRVALELDDCPRRGTVGRSRVAATTRPAELVEKRNGSGSLRVPETARR
jgi:hypothetical protein